MEAEPPLYPVAGAAGLPGDEDRLGAADACEAPLDELVGAYPNYNEEEEERRYYRRKRLGVLKNVLAASAGGTLTYGVYLGLLQMQLILHYDETYREVKYGNMGLPDIDSKMLMGINVTPIAALLYTPVLIRFFGTKWMMFLAVGIYALFVSTNYWERYYTLVPSAVALGMAIVPLWASMGNYITRMSQKYYEYSHYKEQDEQGPQRRPPRGSHAPYLLVFQAIFYSFFHLSFACAQLPMIYFLNHYLYDLNHTLYNVQSCGANSHGILSGFNKTVLLALPRSRNLIVVESVLMAVAFLAMLLVLGLCGAAYRPTEEIDLRSVGWGNIFQLPFKHVRDFRLRHLVPFFIYSGFEVVFACTGLALGYGVCSVGLERLAYLLVAYGLSASAASGLGLLGLWLPRSVPLVTGAGLHLLLTLGLFFWAPVPRVLQHSWVLYVAAALWGVGSALNKTGLSTLLGILYEDKERQDFIFTIYHWWQAVAIFMVYLGASLPMKVPQYLPWKGAFWKCGNVFLEDSSGAGIMGTWTQSRCCLEGYLLYISLEILQRSYTIHEVQEP
ncbi:protein unc-93 homolog B1 isoform X3 [Sciurus carolinensis]|uniref:protein unc-93 homolog B1 isoform X3 n=1 Tax=Sciurus carolinensis TaxID=30640 RepID=UPI001FB2A9F5|nr:protein unc-93 homolog B1 isoform X3 [Sciurus carolinensis]